MNIYDRICMYSVSEKLKRDRARLKDAIADEVRKKFKDGPIIDAIGVSVYYSAKDDGLPPVFCVMSDKGDVSYFSVSNDQLLALADSVVTRLKKRN